MTVSNVLDVNAVPKLVGDVAMERLTESFRIIDNAPVPLYFTGPSGSGKTVVALNLAKAYAAKHKVPAYYVQLSPDMTKTSLILGLRLKNGSLEVVDGVIAQAMRTGGIVIIDEATHTTQELLLMLNSVLDRTSVTSVGDEIIFAKPTFRTVFCSNFGYSGNIKLPQSFAQRLLAFDFDYPTEEDEIKIAKAIAVDELPAGKYDVPEKTVKYLVSLMREHRSAEMPLSVRNVSNALIRLSLTKKIKDPDELDQALQEMPESTARKMAERLSVKSITSVSDLLKSDIGDFMKYMATVSPDKFRDVVRSCFAYHLDIDGVDVANKAWKASLDSSII